MHRSRMAFYDDEDGGEHDLRRAVGDKFFKSKAKKIDYRIENPGRIDFSVVDLSIRDKKNKNKQFFLWAESKEEIGDDRDLLESIAQLILTIGKGNWNAKYSPPKYLGAFDSEKILFVHYADIMEVFAIPGFCWTVTSSDHKTKEFEYIFQMVSEAFTQKEKMKFNFEADEKALVEFIGENFHTGEGKTVKVQVTKNNFVYVFQRWNEEVSNHIAIDWDKVREVKLLPADFYLADLLSRNNSTLEEKNKLRVYLKGNFYELDRELDSLGILGWKRVDFKGASGIRAHKDFWDCYERPPRETFWEFMKHRRDLLVPPGFRENNGSFYTPTAWVGKSQEYIATVLGEDWQSKYYVWDCCAGTGNLLNGLIDKDKIFASDFDKGVVEIMKDRALHGANLSGNNVFQFDFLNDKIEKLPEKLREIVSDPKERQKLLFYINPPYVEVTTSSTMMGTKTHKSKGQGKKSEMKTRYKKQIGKATNELYAQFFARIYDEFSGSWVAGFSTLKILQAPSFKKFREFFLAKLEKMFVVPSNSFDNVNGKFPVGFMVWNPTKKEVFEHTTAEIYDCDEDKKEGVLVGTKQISCPKSGTINDWLVRWRDYKNFPSDKPRGKLFYRGNDFQSRRLVHLGCETTSSLTEFHLTRWNLIVGCIYLAVRWCIKANWLNNRDQFFFPKDNWQEDPEFLDFQADCLAFALFHGQNYISSTDKIENYWIPFGRDDVVVHDTINDLNPFMVDFLNGKLLEPEKEVRDDYYRSNKFYNGTTPVEFSKEAQAVKDAGKEIWAYYHKQRGAKANASLYDIRKYFQGTKKDKKTGKERVNPSSKDKEYMKLHKKLTTCLGILSDKIATKARDYGFLQ